MPRYIDAEKLITEYSTLQEWLKPRDNFESQTRYDFIRQDIIPILKETPTEDVAPVVHAHWVGIEFDGYADGYPVYDVFECSNCGEEHYGEEDTLTAYCPHCGAKMDEKEKKDD